MCFIYHNPRCSKSRQSLDILNNSGIHFTTVKYLEASINKETLRQLIKELNLSPREFIRDNESIFKELKLDNATGEELLEAMVVNPILIQRPIIKTKNGICIGRPPENILKIL